MKSDKTDNWLPVAISGTLILGAVAFLILWALQSAYNVAQ
jgi:hypothetical protein